MSPKKRTLPKISRKQAIVEAAIDCFAKYGVANTTMSQVAERARVDQPLIHYYFPNSQSLHIEVFNHVLNSLKEVTLKSFEPKPSTSREALKKYARAPFEWARNENALFSITLYFYYLTSIEQTFKEMNAKIRETGRERILVLIYEGLERKEFILPKSMTAHDMATTVQSLITGNFILAGTELLSFEKMADLTVVALDQLLIKH